VCVSRCRRVTFLRCGRLRRGKKSVTGSPRCTRPSWHNSSIEEAIATGLVTDARSNIVFSSTALVRSKSVCPPSAQARCSPNAPPRALRPDTGLFPRPRRLARRRAPSPTRPSRPRRHPSLLIASSVQFPHTDSRVKYSTACRRPKRRMTRRSAICYNSTVKHAQASGGFPRSYGYQ